MSTNGDAPSPKQVYTAASAFFEAIWEAGVRYCFVNLGSDHPAVMEAIAYGQRYLKDRFPRIITCPHEGHEMVAMSAADGYARLTGRPQAVIVHVDVGTQALGQAFHNASSGRAPVLVFAGSAPYTQEGELRGSRSEFIHWLQDIPDQRAICAQYCRYSAEVKTGRNIKQVVNRALQIAKSDPKGPAYLMAPREVLEEEPERVTLRQEHWEPIEAGALSRSAVKRIAEALLAAKDPLVVAGFVGRQHGAVQHLVQLADNIKGLRVYDCGMSDMSFPANHRACLTPSTGAKAAIQSADVIIVLDADVPWIPSQTKLRDDVEVFHIDVDPLKQQMQLFYIPAVARYRASTGEALQQLNEYITGSHDFKSLMASAEWQRRWDMLDKQHRTNLNNIASRALPPKEDERVSVPFLSKILKDELPPNTIWASEAVTNHVKFADQIQATIPGSFVTKGGSGLGWNGGAALGLKLAADDLARESQATVASSDRADGKGAGSPRQYSGEPFVAMITGDGSFMFGAPACAAWVASRYEIPTLWVVLNNGGWHAPRHSTLLVWPDGFAKGTSSEDLGIDFGPRTPRYAQIAVAGSAGWLKGWTVEKVGENGEELRSILREAVHRIQVEKKGAIIEIMIA